MRWCTVLLALSLLAGCGKGSTPTTKLGHDDGDVELSDCESVRNKVEELYVQAAAAEEVSANLQAEFVSANLHMVMTDCQTKPRQVLICLRKVQSARELETECLLPLDDAGKTEGQRFADTP